MLHPYITSQLSIVLYCTPTSWKHMPICFYVNTPIAEVLDSFLKQISEGLTEWVNHQASCQGCTPSGWLIETALTPFLQPPACSVNLQTVLNEMSLLWHRPRPRRWTCRSDHIQSWTIAQIHSACQLTWTEESLRWSILRCCNKPRGWERQEESEWRTQREKIKKGWEK